MCQTSKQIIFCSCLDKGNNAEIIGQHKWTLHRFISSKESNVRGKILMPSDVLDAIINISDTITEMNSRNCFDFEYIPQEKDCFRIENGLESPDYKYFSLIYHDGKWQEGRNPSFGQTITENISQGNVRQDFLN